MSTVDAMRAMLDPLDVAILIALVLGPMVIAYVAFWTGTVGPVAPRDRRDRNTAKRV